jgi:hypothetical protein
MIATGAERWALAGCQATGGQAQNHRGRAGAVEHDTGLEGRRAFERFLLSILQRIADSSRTSRHVR